MYDDSGQYNGKCGQLKEKITCRKILIRQEIIDRTGLSRFYKAPVTKAAPR